MTNHHAIFPAQIHTNGQGPRTPYPFSMYGLATKRSEESFKLNKIDLTAWQSEGL